MNNHLQLLVCVLSMRSLMTRGVHLRQDTHDNNAALFASPGGVAERERNQSDMNQSTMNLGQPGNNTANVSLLIPPGSVGERNVIHSDANLSASNLSTQVSGFREDPKLHRSQPETVPVPPIPQLTAAEVFRFDEDSLRIRSLQEFKNCSTPNKNVCAPNHDVSFLFEYLKPGPTKRYKTCAVIGSGGDLQGSDFGEEIDAHDMVMRMNNHITLGHEKDVGTKTTFHFWYPTSIINMMIEEARQRSKLMNSTQGATIQKQANESYSRRLHDKEDDNEKQFVFTPYEAPDWKYSMFLLT